jgi:hypothetical protein
VQAGEPDFGPSKAEIRQAQKLAATFRRAGGIERAFRVLCRAERGVNPRHDAAFTVLVERAAAAMPKLLDAIAAGEAPNAAEHDEIWTCSQEAPRIVATAVCAGRNDADIYEVDRRSETTVDRSRAAAQRALISALGKSGARRRAAIAVLLLTRSSGLESEGCHAGADLVRLATPALVTMLSAKDQEAEVLRLFASGGGDPAAAVPAVRPYLADRKSLPFAAMALARMGQDMSQAVTPLAELLDGPEVDVALDALESIGPSARSVLPRLAALSKRMDATCTKPVEPHRFVRTVAAIATRPEDASIALQTLSPLLRCSSTIASAAEAIGRLGTDGRNALLKYLRDDKNTIQNRLGVAYVLQQGGARLNSGDQEVVRLLQAKTGRYERPQAQVQVPVPERDPIKAVGEEVTACRAEAGLKPVDVTGVSAEQANQVRWCLHSHLCGPSRRTLVRTLDRCCGQVFGARKPPFCRP